MASRCEKQIIESMKEQAVLPDELRALTQAIKFENPSLGTKGIYDKIVNLGGKYSSVTIKRVKRTLQKQGLTSSAMESSDTKLKLTTVGGTSMSNSENADVNDGKSIPNNEFWFPVRLDQPAQSIKEFPYQSIIQVNLSTLGASSDSMGEIYKIQRAAIPDNFKNIPVPLLMYNKDRSRKTFCQPGTPGYNEISKLVQEKGEHGPNGPSAGMKGYFWGRYDSNNHLVYVCTEKLAPSQQW